jgi:phage shock protein PspC (stress-responsive transcriptional regulator)
MNPHTPNPDEGRDPADRTAGQPAVEPAGQPAEQSAAQATGQPAGQPEAEPAAEPAGAFGSAAAEQRPAADRADTAPVDTSATLPLDTSATLPLDFSAGPAGGGTPPPYSGGPTTPPPYYGPTPPPAAGQPQNFFDWIRSQGVHRGRERWIGGVASGIAERFGVDPLIVRGILIVLTVFAGIGVLLYGVAWALLPEPDGRIHVQEAAAGRWSAGMTGALITTIIGFPSLGTGVWGWDRYGFGPFIWTVFWVGGAIYLIYYLTQRNKSRIGATPMSSNPQPGGPAGPAYLPTPETQGASSTPSMQATPSTPTPPSAAAGYGASDTLPRYGESTVPGPAWGPPPPSGPVPPPGGYQPAPGSGPVPPAKPRNFGPGAPAVAVTAGLALLVGGGLKALDVANVIDLGTSSNAVVWASAAAVLGLGIVIAGLRGRTSGILGFFAVVALIVGGIFNVLPNADRFRPQNADWSPVSVEQARSGFDITAGTGTVDLTRLALNPPLRTDLVVPIDATASNLTVIIPDTVPVEIRADMTMGNLHEGSQNHSGMTTQQSHYNTAKPGATLVVKIDGTFSNVTIKEGN